MGVYNKSTVEVRNEQGQWEMADFLPPDIPHPYDDNDNLNEGVFTTANYAAYALFANVRNKDGVVPLAIPRGAPDNAGEEVIRMYIGSPNEEPTDGCYWGWKPREDPTDYFAGDDHSLTHFTIEELLNYPHYDQAIKTGLTLREELGVKFWQTLQAFENWGKYAPKDIRVIMHFQG
ncbi:hypothetical protein [Ewingella americana]|uniref:Uncharacterized protein n=1 Tax=Ewingella americana TaxID=41202 RepID=A0A502GE44_9GAMM|nr:hypothetical protein [Ewingella americana]TPG59902.1 hypothetical protein EAH77_15155 [Ewingella americana]